MSAWGAFRRGWRNSTLYWQALVVLFLVNLLGGGLLALLPALELLGPAHSSAIREAAAGVPTWMAFEILLDPVSSANLANGLTGGVISPALQSGVIAMLLALVLIPWAAWLPGCLVSGGLLLAFKEAPKAFDWRRFLWGCWHYWGAFLLLGLVQTLLTLLVCIPVVIIFSVVIRLVPRGAILAAPVLLVCLIWWTAIFELGQVGLVAGEKRNIGGALRIGIRTLFRRILPLTGYYVLSLAVLLALHLVFRVGLMPRLPLAFWPLVLMVQQTFICLRIWSHASRLAGDVEFVREAQSKENDSLLAVLNQQVIH
jgi:hypothetical protein